VAGGRPTARRSAGDARCSRSLLPVPVPQRHVARGVRDGRVIDDLGTGVRAVAWERSLGQVVLVFATGGALIAGQPFGRTLPLLVAGGGMGSALLVLALARASRTVAADVRSLCRRGALLSIGTASVVVLGGHVVTLAIAARAVGVRMPVADFVPLALLVLLGAGIPLNLAGWGPREGVAAWAFASSGGTASQGLAVAVAFGVIVLVGTLPGAVLLLFGRARRAAPRAGQAPLASAGRAAPATLGADAGLGVAARG